MFRPFWEPTSLRNRLWSCLGRALNEDSDSKLKKNTGRSPSIRFRPTSSLRFLEPLGEGNREGADVFARRTPLASKGSADTVLYYTILYYSVLYFIILHYTMLFNTILALAHSLVARLSLARPCRSLARGEREGACGEPGGCAAPPAGRPALMVQEVLGSGHAPQRTPGGLNYAVNIILFCITHSFTRNWV